MAEFAPLQPLDGYLPIEDHGLIGDGATAALVARDGAVDWLCAPRFDSPPLFARILDARGGGSFLVAPESVVEARQFYLGESGVLITELRGEKGLVRLTDALTLNTGADLNEDVRAARGELIRHVRVMQGRVRLLVRVQPLGLESVEHWGEGLRLRCGSRSELDLSLTSTVPLAGPETTLDLREGEELDLVLRWAGSGSTRQAASPAARLQGTVDAWKRWVEKLEYEGPQRSLVRRSVLTLKMLDHFESGAIVAAPTSSLPEEIGGERNWDYRYAWIRDAAFSVHAFHRIGLTHEAAGFLSWVLSALERHGPPRVLYDLDGEEPGSERKDRELEGYRRSAPVRWGNGAAAQLQHDVYGEILDCAYQWTRHHSSPGAELWEHLRALVEAAGKAWRTPDHGIWEVRSAARPFTYSAALCHVALDRGVRMSQRFGLTGDAAAWRLEAERIRTAVLEEAWDKDSQTLTEQLGGGGVDASLLTLPLRRVVPADHPRMKGTVEAIKRRLDAGDGLLYRYLPEESPDGLRGGEGAFLLCSFWLVDNLALQGRVDEALALYESLCARANPLGLLPEQIDPGSGAFLGNFPQAFSHIGLIGSGVNLARFAAERS